jgi:hypothetical protein
MQPVSESLVLHRVMCVNQMPIEMNDIAIVANSIPRYILITTHFHLHDLDHVKTPEPPADLMSVQNSKFASTTCNMKNRLNHGRWR